jgi:hypothetical protein
MENGDGMKLVLSIVLGLLMLGAAGAPASGAGESPWWQRETQMKGLRLRLDRKDWWPRALQLKPGEKFTVRSTLEGGGLMIVRRLGGPAMSKFGTGVTDVIQWMIDDDGDMDPADPKADLDSDCIVSDFGADGLADEMIDFIDDNGDNKADEMERRTFVQGELRYAWISLDLNHNGKMWTLDPDFMMYRSDDAFFGSDHPYGDGLIFVNKIDPRTKSWIPFSECPFRWFDADRNGYSEVVVRFSALPMSYAGSAAEADAANSYAIIGGSFQDAMNDMGVLNIRYSFDMDTLSGPRTPLHFDMGFNMVGAERYDFPGMRHTNKLRRPPRTVVVADPDSVRKIADEYDARQTGFSFYEYEDNSIAIGDPAHHPELDRRWEGVFWTWERAIMPNTGGPTQTWNMRREFRPTPAGRREVYYSPVDRRLHLKGAAEGWMHVGMILNDAPLGEWRVFDVDGDGYIDEWQYFRVGENLPYRTAIVTGVKNRDFGDDYQAMSAFYTGRALPDALEANGAFIEAVKRQGAPFAHEVPVNLGQALERAASPSERRYISDLIRERYYLSLRDAALGPAQKALDTAARITGPRYEQSQAGGRVLRAELRASEVAWKLTAEFNRLDRAYERGDYVAAAGMVGGVAELAKRLIQPAGPR